MFQTQLLAECIGAELNSRFDTQEKSIAQILSLKHQKLPVGRHVNASRQQLNLQQTMTIQATQLQDISGNQRQTIKLRGRNSRSCRSSTSGRSCSPQMAETARIKSAGAPLQEQQLQRKSITTTTSETFPSNSDNRFFFFVIFQNRIRAGNCRCR